MAPTEVAQCQADMAATAKMIDDILGALSAVPAMFGNQTWQGPAADEWATGWHARNKQLTTLLHAVLAEQPRLVARAEEAERRKVAS